MPLVRRLALRVLLGVGLWLPVWVFESAAHNDPDPPLLLLVCVVGVVALGAALDALTATGERWGEEAGGGTRPGGRDRATATYLRVLEDHRTAREPSVALRDRLSSLADRTLDDRHGVRLASPEGRELLGPETVAVLEAPPHRIPLPRVEACLRRIEQL